MFQPSTTVQWQKKGGKLTKDFKIKINAKSPSKNYPNMTHSVKNKPALKTSDSASNQEPCIDRHHH